MTPTAKSKLNLLFPAIFAILLVLFSFQLAVSYDKADQKPLSYKIQTDKGIGTAKKFNFSYFITDVGNRISNHPYEIKWSKSTPKFLFGCALVLLLSYVYAKSQHKKYISGKEYGTSEWSLPKALYHLHANTISREEIKKLFKAYRSDLVSAFKEAWNMKHISLFIPDYRTITDDTLKKLEAIKNKYLNADMILTKTERISLHNHELNNNTLIVGGAGALKTRGYVVPNILQTHSSYVVTDPKGEILEKTGYYLQKSGYKIRVLNLNEKKRSNGYNPFHYIHKERNGWEERVFSLIDTIIMNTDGGQKQKSSDPFWDKGEKLYMMSLFFAVMTAFPNEERNMTTVLLLNSWLEIEEDRDHRNSDLDIFFHCYEEQYGKDDIAASLFNEFRSKAAGKTAKSIVMSVVVRLAPFQIKEIKRIFSYDEMKLDTVGEQKVAVFVVVPPTDPSFNFVAGMLFTQLFQELNYCALVKHEHDGGQLPIPCRFILDEFANTCRIPNFLQILAYARSLGIGITPIIQSLDQIKAMYPEQWGDFMNNCNTVLFLGKNMHTESLKYFSEMLGPGTYDKKSIGVQKGTNTSDSTNDDKIGRKLMDEAELRKLKNDHCVLFVSGYDPFYSQKYDSTLHPNYKYTSEANPKYSYHFTPPQHDVKSPHREENPEQPKQIPLKIKDLQIDTDTKHISEILSTHLLSMDFDNDENFIVDDGEVAEIEQIAALEKESEQIESNVLDITSKVIELKVADDNDNLLIQNAMKNSGNVDFDKDDVLEPNDGEPSAAFDIQTATELVNEISSLNSDLKEDMPVFTEELLSFDTNSLANP